jgi:hypothetical protein
MAPSLRGGAGRARATGEEHIDKRLKDSNHPLRKSIVFVLPEVGVRFLIRVRFLMDALPNSDAPVAAAGAGWRRAQAR